MYKGPLTHSLHCSEFVELALFIIFFMLYTLIKFPIRIYCIPVVNTLIRVFVNTLIWVFTDTLI